MAAESLAPWRAWPKVELHLHLDCSLSYEGARQLDHTMTPERYAETLVAPAKCLNLADYLACTRATVELLQTEQGLRVAVDDLARQLAADGVIYAELRFAPLLHLGRGLLPEQVVTTVADQVVRSSQATGVALRLILCTLRHFSAEESLTTARLVEQFYPGGVVVALDIAGDEAGYPLDAHRAAFEQIAARGISCTAHAGEAAGPASVRETLAALRPSRLGHGVRSIEDPALVEQIMAQGIHLEICPACNVQIALVDTLADHPVDRLYRRGVSLGINTDTRATTPTTLAADYSRLSETFGWTKADFLAVNLNAIRAAFAPPDVRRAIEARLIAGYAGPGSE